MITDVRRSLIFWRESAALWVAFQGVQRRKEPIEPLFRSQRRMQRDPIGDRMEILHRSMEKQDSVNHYCANQRRLERIASATYWSGLPSSPASISAIASWTATNSALGRDFWEVD